MDWKVLCVDDERSSLINLEYDLKNKKNIESVQVFTNPMEALEHARKYVLHVAFLDMMMPVMSGVELAIELKGIHPDIKLVFLSGEEIFKKEAERIGAVGYLLKPYMTHELEDVLQRICDIEKR